MALWKKIKHTPSLGLVLLAYVAFVALGMPDGLLGVAWPTVRASFSVPLDAIGMLISASVAGYLTSSFLSGWLISRWGIGRTLAASCALTGVALVGYTLAPAWWMMAPLYVMAGLGAGAIDAGLNSYIAANFGEGLMQWLHASYGVGITSGPIIMTFALGTFLSWRLGYRIVGGFQLLLACLFVFTLPIWTRRKPVHADETAKLLTDYKTPLGETLRQPRVWLSMLIFLFYVGAEVSIGTWTYSLLTESRGVDPTLAGFVAGSYWATFTIGRIIAGVFARRIGVNGMVRSSIALAMLSALLLLWNPSQTVNLIAVALIGFAVAPIFPALMSGTSRRVGDQHAANTIGMQITATGLGMAFIPSLMGVLARRFSLEVIPLCLIVVFGILFTLFTLSVSAAKKQAG